MATAAAAAGVMETHAHAPLWLALFVVGIGAACAGALLALAPAKADQLHFAIATLAFSLACAIVRAALPGKYWSISGPPQHGPAAAVAVLALCIVFSIAASRRIHLSFAAQAVAAALAGVLYPNAFASLGGGIAAIAASGLAVAVASIGGPRNAFGPLVGAVVLAIACAALQRLTDQLWLVAGLLLAATLVWAPGGLIGLAASSYRAFPKRGVNGAA